MDRINEGTQAKGGLIFCSFRQHLIAAGTMRMLQNVCYTSDNGSSNPAKGCHADASLPLANEEKSIPFMHITCTTCADMCGQPRRSHLKAAALLVIATQTADAPESSSSHFGKARMSAIKLDYVHFLRHPWCNAGQLLEAQLTFWILR
jgi:hypothetical protein